MKTQFLPPLGQPGIIYSQYARRHMDADQCVALHGLTYLLAGSLRVTEAGQSHVFEAGSLLFSRKNFLAKFTKQPAGDAPFRAITVVFDVPTLLAASPPDSKTGELPHVGSPAVTALHTTPLLQQFGESLQRYFKQPMPAPLAQQKQQEALTLLLHAYPALQPVLFHFAPPGKIDLEAFMRQHFRFNVDLRQLAYLTGRSLASFKRDFHRIFRTSPARWLYQQRLAEAHYLLQEEHKRPSDVYHEVGFESLAHFSHAFKRQFGYPPSSVYTPGLADQRGQELL
ncbi:helix-turn-helix transcriptional regulator [Hymenobacter profundi]|uniref:AraC family transcriptional regulator n=1 Tax=Hymenobacter profundi TaxID=1982110 RepID=A0ABS6X0Y5_9BACT|nr:AraC family transcriptional regulator [Hymenobacter profundi]MBW3129443.1 AraC family transcriptional regulator [Hymenobacter profundi]